MKYFIPICVLLLSCHLAAAQHDLYRWQLSGHTGIANYYNEDNSASDYFRINHNLLHRVELSRHLGNSLGLSLGYSFGEIRGIDQQRARFTTDVRMSSVRAYFYTDNGWLLNTSALVSPYLFGGYGLSILETRVGSATEESRYVSAIPFGLGLKFRLAERWQLGVQAEAVYLTERHLRQAELEQNEHNNSFVQTGVTIGYSFGFRKSEFRATQFYTGNVDLLQSLEREEKPRQNVLELLLKLEPRKVQFQPRQDSSAFVQPDLVERDILLPVDTLKTIRPTLETDSVRVPQPEEVAGVPVERTAIQDTTMLQDTTARAAERTAPAGAVTRPDTAAVRLRTLQPATGTEKRAQAADTLGARRQTITRREPGRTRETRRVEERIVYAPARRDRDAEIARLLQEQRRLTNANAEINRLRSRLDSLQAAQPQGYPRAEYGGMERFLEEQANLNDSMLHRLRAYEQELLQLQETDGPAAARPALTAAPPRQQYEVFFPINSHRVPLESLSDISQLLRVLEENPNLRVRLTGHASQSGSAAYNMALSRKRAEGLMNLMVRQGIARERISIQYMGDENSSDWENRMDRRVEAQLTE